MFWEAVKGLVQQSGLLFFEKIVIGCPNDRFYPSEKVIANALDKDIAID